jgi:SAM-dependent methyltransferase
MPNMRELRRSKIREHVDVERSSILEIGALDYPTYTRPEHRVWYVDYASTDELAKKGEQNPRYARERLVEVDFVSPTPSYSQFIEGRFDLVIANHVIEHVPDTIRWLQELHAVSAPKGCVFLSIPDKRYTFDIMRRNTTFIDLLRNYDERVQKPTVYQILEHFYYHKSVSATEVWEGTHHDKLDVLRFSVGEALEVARKHAAASYADVHCHVFTSESFRGVISPLMELGMVPFEIEMMGSTVPMTNEFHVLLRTV